MINVITYHHRQLNLGEENKGTVSFRAEWKMEQMPHEVGLSAWLHDILSLAFVKQKCDDLQSKR